MAAPDAEPEVRAEACVRGDAALARAFTFLGRRWNAMLLGALSDRDSGFRQLARDVPGISDSMLSDRLSALAATGLITRKVAEGPPVTVTYALTDRGRALMPALAQISAWAQEHLPPDAQC